MANAVSHAALPYPIKNARFTLAVPFLDADGDPLDPTTPDTEVSQDGGAFADAAEEVTTISGSNGAGYITLTGAETNNSVVVVAFKVASGPKATLMTLYPAVLASVGTGTLSAGSAGGGTLGTLLTYDVTGCFIRTTGGTGGGGAGGLSNQARKIATYNTGTGAFTVVPNWETTPDATTTYEVHLPEGVTLGMLRTLNPTTAGHTLTLTANKVQLADAAHGGSSANMTFGAVACSTFTASGAVAFQSTFAVTGATTLAAVTASGTVTFNAFTVSAATTLSGAVSLGATLGITGAITATNASNNLTLGTFTVTTNAMAWNASWDTEVQSEVQDAIEVNHLDHLLAADYNPASQPGVATALLNELIGNDGGVSQFTANALELAPTGGSSQFTAAQMAQLRGLRNLPAPRSEKPTHYLVEGSTRLTAQSTQLQLLSGDGSWAIADGDTVNLSITRSVDGDEETVTCPGTIIEDTGAGQQIDIDISSANAALLTVGTWEGQLWRVRSSQPHFLQDYRIVVTEDLR